MNLTTEPYPEEPQHLYRIDWWEVALADNFCYVVPCHAVYYGKTTPYSEVVDSDYASDLGAPVHAEWMKFEGDLPECRMVGWHGMRYLWSATHRDHPAFATELEAREWVVKEMLGYLERKEREMIAIRARIDEQRRLMREVG